MSIAVITDFVREYDIEYSALMNTKLHGLKDIDMILELYAIYKPSVVKDVFIGDVIGASGLEGKNLLEVLEMLYGGNTTYSSRSDEYLKYSKKDLLDNVKKTTRGIDKMEFIGISSKRFILSGNGRHRYCALAALYLADRKKGMSEEELRKMYTISASVDELDLIKTYSNYILSKVTDGKYHVVNDWDKEYRVTGKAAIRRFDGIIEDVVDDKTLIDTIKLDYLEDVGKFENEYKNNLYFKNFVDKCLKIRSDDHVGKQVNSDDKRRDV